MLALLLLLFGGVFGGVFGFCGFGGDGGEAMGVSHAPGHTIVLNSSLHGLLAERIRTAETPSKRTDEI